MRHHFSNPETALKHSFERFKSEFVRFDNEVYSGDVAQYVEGLPDAKRKAIYREMTNLLGSVKHMMKIFKTLKERG